MIVMKCIKKVIPLLGIYLLTACGATSTTTSSTSSANFDVLNEWGELYAQSYYPSFEAQSKALNEALVEYCLQASDKQLSNVQQAWFASHQSWQTLRIINVGPLKDGFPAYGDRIHAGNLFDDDGVTAVDDLLNKEPLVASIANDSVLVQGMPALEYILFDKIPALALSPSQCLWAQGIAENLYSTAMELHTQWLENLADFKNPAQITSGYTDRTQVLTAVLNGINEYIEIIARYKINRPMGIENAVPDLSSVEGRFSGDSFLVIAKNIAGLKRLLIGGEFNVITLLENVGGTQYIHTLQTIMGSLDAQLVIIEAAGIDVLSIDTGSDNPVRGAYIQLHDDLTALSALLFDHVIDAVGGTALFNSVDGD
jgi:predicted lipoprotein